MSNTSGVVDFGFDDGKTIKNAGVEAWKQSRSGEKSRVSICSFKRFFDVVSAKKVRESGKPMTDQEKADLGSKIDARLAIDLKKPVEDLTEVDRLDIKSPKFSYAWTHYDELVGTIRCLGVYEGNTLKTPGLCCDRFKPAEQTVGTVVVEYPVDDELKVDVEDLLKRKHTTVGIWKLGSKKFKKLEGAYIDSRNMEPPMHVIDLRVTMDGDAKFQKQEITSAGLAHWARQDCPREVYNWILDQGLRAHKHVSNSLGFDMSREKLIERLGGGGGGGGGNSGGGNSLGSGNSGGAPVLQPSYDDLIS